MTTFLIAPTEPPILKALGTVSLTPENYGVDVLWPCTPLAGLVGVQRKEFSDLYASMIDGRLGKELQQMRALSLSMLIVEGRPQWGLNGELIDNYIHHFTYTQYRRLIYGIQAMGCMVSYTRTIPETADVICDFAAWTEKTEHRSLISRPGPSSQWGADPSNADWQAHLLASFPGINTTLARRIIAHFNGPPIALTVTAKQLTEVEGIGKKKAERIISLLKGTDHP